MRLLVPRAWHQLHARNASSPKGLRLKRLPKMPTIVTQKDLTTINNQ